MISSEHLLNRKVVKVRNPTNSRLNISVLQWNLLATCYLGNHAKISNEHKSFNYRKTLISKEIQNYNPDVAFLEEIDVQDLEFYESLAKSLDYVSFFGQRHGNQDGTALWFKKSFECVEKWSLRHTHENGTVDNQISQFGVLKKKDDLGTDIYFIVAAIHFKSGFHKRGARVRQATQFMDALTKTIEKYSQIAKEPKNLAIIFGGDFNDEEGTAPLNVITGNSKHHFGKVFGADEKFTFWHCYTLPLFLTWTSKLSIDFVFHSKNLVLTSKSEGPSEEEIGNSPMFSEKFPSDHVSCYCEFALVDCI